MRYSFTALLLCICFISSQAQFSLQYKHSINNTEWQNTHSELADIGIDVFSNNPEVTLAYWFKLKNKRVEFQPGISFAWNHENANVIDGSNYDYKWNSYYLDVPVHFYLLDFEGDCNCPTFSKDGSFFEKGVYVYVSPGIGYHDIQSSLDYGNLAGGIFNVESDNTAINGRIAAGVGVDIGLFDLLTISPSIGFAYGSSIQWDLINRIDEQVNDASTAQAMSSYTSLHPGIRLTFRPDYLREKRRYKFR